MYKRKPHILFLSTDNSCRSIIAEAFSKEIGSNYFVARSAGIDTHVVCSNTIATMNRIGIDISNYNSNRISDNLLHWCDTVIAMSTSAKTHCPILPKSTQLTYWPLTDKNTFLGTETDIAAQFDTLRNNIKVRVTGVIGGIKMLASDAS